MNISRIIHISKALGLTDNYDLCADEVFVKHDKTSGSQH